MGNKNFSLTEGMNCGESIYDIKLNHKYRFICLVKSDIMVIYGTVKYMEAFSYISKESERGCVFVADADVLYDQEFFFEERLIIPYFAIEEILESI